MKKLLLTRQKRIIFKAILVFLGLGFLSSSTFAQTTDDNYPNLPVLSLGVNGDGYGKGKQGTGDLGAWYPDNRIWITPSTTDKQHEVVIPVFITNRWRTTSGLQNILTTAPISSFSFKLYYNGNVLEFLSLQNNNPFTETEANSLGITKFSTIEANPKYVTPLANHFHLEASPTDVADYPLYFNNKKAPVVGGKAVKITGVAFNDLSLDTTKYGERKVLLYARFKVKSNVTSANASSYLYFDPTYLLYNGINIANDVPLKLLSKCTDPSRVQYLQARSNNLRHWITDNMINLTDPIAELKTRTLGLSQEYNVRLEDYNNEPYLPGSIALNVLPSLPEFKFTVVNSASRLGDKQIYRETVNGVITDSSTWVLGDPITTDNPLAMPALNPSSLLGNRFIDVDLPEYLMEDIIIESDQAWLKFQTVAVSSDYKNPITNPTRRGYIQYINKLVGNTSNPFSIAPADQYTKDKYVRLAILCDPQEISNYKEKPGMYTGYVTFKSVNDKFEPTRIKVTFVYIANPLEANSKYSSINPEIPKDPFTYGIHLKLTPGVDTANAVKLIMGTGTRATNYVDTLYGEFPQTYALGKDKSGYDKLFDARFVLDTTIYPAPAIDADSALWKQWYNLKQYGFGDLAQSESNPRSNSRDIRVNHDTTKSHIYKVNYKWNNTVDYSNVTLEWDASEFLANSSIYLKYYSSQGKEHYIDMKTEGAPKGNNIYAFIFDDRNVTEFTIEYTIALNVFDNLENNFGDSLIQANAWNLLSLPLKPSNPDYLLVFTGAENIPYMYTPRNWQQIPDRQVHPGYGYFISYGEHTTKKFVGAYFHEINKNINPVLLYKGKPSTIPGFDDGGWNTIGGLSARYPLYNSNSEFTIRFDPYELGGAAANRAYTEKKLVWAYRPHKGYDPVPELFPGVGYWIKVDSTCYLNLSATNNLTKEAISVNPAPINIAAGFDQITIADNAQNMTSVYATTSYIDANDYQLPPMPPQGMFDVRYNTGNYATNGTESTVQLQGVQYPVSVNIDKPKADYSVVDVNTNYVYGTVKAGQSGNILINDRITSFKLNAVAVENTGLSVNIGPNPVTTSNATMTFSIEEAAYVTIAVYNSLGDKVATLIDGSFNAGLHNESINLNNLPTGNYNVKMIAGSKSTVCRINIIK